MIFTSKRLQDRYNLFTNESNLCHCLDRNKTRQIRLQLSLQRWWRFKRKMAKRKRKLLPLTESRYTLAMENREHPALRKPEQYKSNIAPITSLSPASFILSSKENASSIFGVWQAIKSSWLEALILHLLFNLPSLNRSPHPLMSDLRGSLRSVGTLLSFALHAILRKHRIVASSYSLEAR